MTIQAHLIGYPRIGPKRELKWALERAWAGRLERPQLDARIGELRAGHLAEQRELTGSAVDDFFLYDAVLETALMFGLVPDGLGASLDDDPFGVLTALARGTPQREAWEMTKWFDTNYHFVVPEVGGPVAELRPLPWREPTGEPDTRWAIVGPYSLAKLSKVTGGVDRAAIATSAGAALWRWVRARVAVDPGFALQVDEPCLGLVLSEDDAALRDAAYAEADGLGLAAAPTLSVQFGTASAETIERLGRRGFAVQIPLDSVARLHGTPAWKEQPLHVVSVLDGRSVWPDDFERARRVLEPLAGEDLRIVPTTSFLFLPYTVEGEELPTGFQFAREKARALGEWARALAGGQPPAVPQPPPVEWPQVGDLTPRAPRPERRQAQADLDLPRFPTTSTGSLPQTSEVRQLRVRLDRGEIDAATYEAAMAQLITDAIAWQEEKGIDVLVHGEFERTDMVEYFAEKMDGFYTTRNGWVLSYGSRCVRPPVLAAPPSISEPMTVREWRLAQNATSKPVKGMLTGPVTIVNWSFRPPGVPDDRLFWAVAQPIAEEVRHLVEAGARVIQVDEPAVRERWPLPTEDAAQKREIYARGVRAALNHVFNQPAHVQMHTHMCYGDFGDIVPLWADAGVDVASIEFSRSKDDSYIRQFYELFADGHLQIGPGVFDVHSPHSPGTGVMDERLAHFRGFMAVEDLWVNPDCGLKTRRWEEIDRQLGDMVEAARHLRRTVEAGAARTPATAGAPAGRPGR
jgi:5-methyltetrahydropteroyltriglutamate--homocysteine methyltransferase